MKETVKAKGQTSRVRTKRFLVDLEACAACPDCVAKCDYFYRLENHGVLSVRERAALSVVCRRCENPLCISACTREALEKDASGILRRHNMLCVGCKSCSVACPFGTLLPETIPYMVSVCDYCQGNLQDDKDLICVKTCPLNAIRFGTVEEDVSLHNYDVDEHLVAHALPWKKEGVTE